MCPIPSVFQSKLFKELDRVLKRFRLIFYEKTSCVDDAGIGGREQCIEAYAIDLQIGESTETKGGCYGLFDVLSTQNVQSRFIEECQSIRFVSTPLEIPDVLNTSRAVIDRVNEISHDG